MRVGGKSRIAPPTYKYVLRPKGWVHEDGRVRTFTCDVERSVVVVLRCYTLHGQLVTTSKALTQIRRDIVSGDMTLKPSRKDVCETFHAGRCVQNYRPTHEQTNILLDQLQKHFFSHITCTGGGGGGYTIIEIICLT